eukprot:TRINITY_DN4405_c0_g1_i2.p1 TRINITY_DN4405_c0_g1~~TRINITY_DN4405_c0_g1_i2.p1  ORF type:complete len:194 (-),score=41.39 TRINITY_DN4405_c0_g1_i2:60-641(-)
MNNKHSKGNKQSNRFPNEKDQSNDRSSSNMGESPIETSMHSKLSPKPFSMNANSSNKDHSDGSRGDYPTSAKKLVNVARVHSLTKIKKSQFMSTNSIHEPVLSQYEDESDRSNSPDAFQAQIDKETILKNHSLRSHTINRGLRNYRDEKAPETAREKVSTLEKRYHPKMSGPGAESIFEIKKNVIIALSLIHI